MHIPDKTRSILYEKGLNYVSYPNESSFLWESDYNEFFHGEDYFISEIIIVKNPSFSIENYSLDSNYISYKSIFNANNLLLDNSKTKINCAV